MTFQYCFDGSIKKVNNLSVSSPRTWGCFPRSCQSSANRRVFPTHVGVFLDSALKAESSPRTWGCFYTSNAWATVGKVFPTHVGVFPLGEKLRKINRRLPHARGGVSGDGFGAFDMAQSSPRTWGCFQVDGTFGKSFVGLPHARGGVSSTSGRFFGSAMSSPRTWGCFQVVGDLGPGCVVFPTHVGVFLHELKIYGDGLRLPHARGGVSKRRARPVARKTSSPRTWGCFRRG